MTAYFPQIDVYRTGQNIKKIMQLQQLTVKDIQEYLGLSVPQSIYHWFEGKSLPTMDNLYALSELFRLPMDALVCGNRREQFRFYRCPAFRRYAVYYEKFMAMCA